MSNELSHLAATVGALQKKVGTLAVVITKTDTGDPGSATAGTICINTFDNNVKVYADGAWRQLATW